MRAASIGPVLCIVLGAMLAPVVSRAQDPVHRRYTMSDGLPSDHIYSVTQDRNGFIWFGTDAGASRFDGTSFTNFSLKDGLPDHEVLNIAEDSQGRIWFMLLSGKLCYWKDGELHHEGTDPGLRYDKVTSGWQTMGEDSQGRIWFGGVYGTLIRLDREARVDSVFDRSRPSFSGPGFIFSIVRDENGQMLIFQGPVMSVPRGDSLATVPVEHQVVHLGMVMSAARPGRPALALTPQGISTFRADGKCTDIPIPVRFDPTIGRRCWEDREGNIWVQRRMNGIGLLVREGSGFRYRSLFEADRVNHALVDREGERWLCTDKGVVRFNQDQERSRSYTAPGNEGFLSLHVTDAGRIYAGGEEKGLYVLQDDRLMPFHLPADQLGPGRVLGMETDREGGLWIGTDFSLYHMDPRGVVGVVPYDFRKAEVRARDRMGVRSVTVGADGKVFTGGVGVQEVFPYGKGFMRVHHLWKHTKHHRVNEIHRDARGRVWYANGEWLHVLTGDSIRTIPIKQFTSGKRISDIAELGRDTILVATSGGGMVLLDTAVRAHRLVGLSDRAGDIRRIRVHEGRIWTATADGVYIHVLEGLELEEQLHIRGSHGLISADCRDVWPLRTGALVATSKGITLFDHLPEPRKGSGPLSLYFPSITCDDSMVSAFDTIRLVTGRTVLSVTVRQVGFIDEGKGEY
ncbi:MAG TPA: two-component regulator propeller domain-containing protein, partial [Flavobacteriales bacterium]